MPSLEHNALTLLLLQMVVILGVARTLALGARRLGQPAVIAEVVAGVLLGPSLLGAVAPGAFSFLFPVASLPGLKLLSQLGLIFFMFLVGLEFDPRRFVGHRRASVAISHASIVVPFVLGVGLGWGLFERYAGPGTPRAVFLAFLGVAMSVTAFPVLARILAERNLVATRVGAIALACAAVDDVTAWCLLAFVVAMARAQGLAQAAWTTGLAVSFIALMVGVARPLLRRLGRHLGSEGELTPGVVVVALLLLLASAAATEAIGIRALFGAFLLGVVAPKEGRLARALAARLEVVPTYLLLPLFFAYSGLRTQVGLLAHATDWAVTGLVIVVATVGKFGGSAVAGRLTGLSWREASTIGVLMNTRGLMELIVLNIGLDLGVISPTVFTMLVLMALVTTFITSPVLRVLYPDALVVRDRAGDAGG